MKKNEQKNKVFSKRSKYGSMALVSALVIGILFGYMTFPHPQLVRDDDGRSWHILFDGNLAQAAEGNPGAGSSGILEIFFINHSVGNDYKAINTSATLESWCNDNLAAGGGNAWVNADDFNLELKHSVLFDIAIKVRVNMSDSGDGSDFNENWVRMNITSTDLGISADTGMEKNVLVNNSGYEYMWVMFYYDFSNAGYDLSKDESADITSIKLQAYY